MLNKFNYDMSQAPRDGTLLLLLLDPDEKLEHPLDDTPEYSRTVGFNNFDHDNIDEWKFAGWSWCNDEFTRGEGTPIAWMLYPEINKEGE